MSYPAVSVTFVDGVSADASQINSNNQDCINGITDGSKDLNVASATFNGAVAVAGTMTVSGSFFSHGRESGYRTFFTLNGLSYVFTGVGTGFVGYGNFPGTKERSVVMFRSGCVRAVSLVFQRIGSTAANAFTASLMKNNAALVTYGPWTLTASGNMTSVLATYPRGTYDFSAGDRLGLYRSGTVTGVALGYIGHGAVVEVQFY